MFKNYDENEARKLVPDRFFFKKKENALYQVKAGGLQLHFIIFRNNKNKLFKTLHYWARDMLNFHFLDKSLGIVSPGHFLYNFSATMIPMLYSMNWTNFIAWLLLLLEILGNICISIVCYSGCDVLDFEINLIFLIDSSFLHD